MIELAVPAVAELARCLRCRCSLILLRTLPDRLILPPSLPDRGGVCSPVNVKRSLEAMDSGLPPVAWLATLETGFSYATDTARAAASSSALLFASSDGWRTILHRQIGGGCHWTWVLTVRYAKVTETQVTLPQSLYGRRPRFTVFTLEISLALGSWYDLFTTLLFC